MNKNGIFTKELNYIKDTNLLADAKYLIDNLPDYFFEIGASSTGKYHPKYAAGTAGLVRHSKAAVRIANELLTNPLIGNKYTAREKDLMLISLILHDGFKHGKVEEKYSRTDHPLISSNYIKEHMDKLTMKDDDIELVSNVISSHMGPWNKDFDGNEVLPVPKTKYESFVHMCDYLASKKFLKVEFDQNNDIME